MKKVLALVGVLMMSTACSSAKDILVEGRVIFSTQSINSTLWGVHTDKPNDKTTLFKFPKDSTDIKHLTKINQDTFVFSVMGNSLEPGKENDRELIELNHRTGVYRRLREGDNSVYIPKHHKLIFYSYYGGLLIADYDSPIESAIPIGRGLGGIYLQVIPISDDEIVMTKYDKKSRPIGNWKYNIVTKDFTELIALKECSLTGIWRSKTKQLLCKRLVDLHGNGRKIISKQFYLTSLDGIREKMVPLNNVDPALYVEEHDVLIVGVTRLEYFPPREAHDMWAYSFSEDKDMRLFKDTWVKVGGLVWNE